MLPITHAWVNYQSQYKGCSEPEALFASMILPDLPAFSKGYLSWEPFEGVKKNSELAGKIENELIGLGLISHGAADEISHGSNGDYMTENCYSVGWFKQRFGGFDWANLSARKKSLLHNLTEGMLESYVIGEYPEIVEISSAALNDAKLHLIARDFAKVLEGKEEARIYEILEKSVKMVKRAKSVCELFSYFVADNKEKEYAQALKQCIMHSRSSIADYLATA